MEGASGQKKRMLRLLGHQNENLALLCAQTRVGPSFCNNMEMVKRDRSSTNRMRAAFTETIGSALGVPGYVWDDGPEVGRGPILVETSLTPWDVQVQAQRVRLAGKLRQTPAPSANRSLNGELGKALASAKMNAGAKNTLLEDSMGPARAWGLPLVRPTQGVAKQRWKERLNKGMKAATTAATTASQRVRPESLGKGGRQASAIYVGFSATGTPGKEAALKRQQIPSRSLRAGLRNMTLGCVPHTRGALSRMASGWEELGPEKQRNMLQCPCRNREGRRGGKPQDAVHMILECNETEPVRHRVRAAMDAVVEREGNQEDKEKWAQMSSGQKLTFSLGTFSMLSPEAEHRAKSAGAREWVVGMHEAAAQLEVENAGFIKTVEREALLIGLGRAEAHDWAGAYEDIHNYLGGHLPWPIREEGEQGQAGGPPGHDAPRDQRSGAL